MKSIKLALAALALATTVGAVAPATKRVGAWRPRYTLFKL